MVVAPEAIAAGVKIAPSLFQAFKQWYDSSSPMSTNSSSRNINGGRQSGGKKRQNKQRRQASGNGSDPSPKFVMSRPISGGSPENVRFHFKDVTNIPNFTTAGSVGYVFPLAAVTDTTGGFTLGSVFPRFLNFSNLYRQFVIHKLIVKWVPNQAFTASGSVCFGVDTSPTVASPTGFSEVVHHNPSVLVDIKSPAQIVYYPVKKDPRYCQNSAGMDEDQLSYGALQFYSNNSLGASAQLGLLWMEMDVTFIGPT